MGLEEGYKLCACREVGFQAGGCVSGNRSKAVLVWRERQGCLCPKLAEVSYEGQQLEPSSATVGLSLGVLKAPGKEAGPGRYALCWGARPALLKAGLKVSASEATGSLSAEGSAPKEKGLWAGSR